jgi:hypothetical protein
VSSAARRSGARGKELGQCETGEEFASWVPLRPQLFGEFSEEDKPTWAVLESLQDEVGLSIEEVNAPSRAAALT